MIPAVVPRGQSMQSRRYISHIILAQGVSIQGINGQDEQAGTSWITRVVSTLRYRRQDLLVVEANWWCGGQIGRFIVQWIDVDEELIVASCEVEAGLHSARTSGECVKGFFIVLGLGEDVVRIVWRPDERGQLEGIVN